MKLETLIRNGWEIGSKDFRIRFNHDKALELILKIAHQLQRQDGYLKFHHIPPETIMPRDININTDAHALFLLYSVALDSMRQSKHVYRSARRMVTEFNVSDFADYGYDDFKSLIRAVNLGDGMNDPARIMEDCTRLAYSGRSRPLVLLEGIKDYDDAAQMLKTLKGVSDGKAALIIKNFQRFGYMHLDDPYDVEMKIDRHLIKMSIGNRVADIDVIDTEKARIRLDRFVDPLRLIYREVMRDNRITLEKADIDPIKLCDSRYVIGSELCIKKRRMLCDDYCPLDCDMLVYMDKKATVIEFPTETRENGEGTGNPNYICKQMDLFE